MSNLLQNPDNPVPVPEALAPIEAPALGLENPEVRSPEAIAPVEDQPKPSQPEILPTQEGVNQDYASPSLPSDTSGDAEAPNQQVMLSPDQFMEALPQVDPNDEGHLEALADQRWHQTDS